MAYAAVISLKLTIDRLLNSSHTSPIVQYSSPQTMDFLYEELRSLIEILETLDKSINNINMERMNTLDGQIKDVVYELEDAIESHVTNQFRSQNEERSSLGGAGPFSISIDLKELKQDFNSLIERAKYMKEEYIQELSNPLPEKVKDVQPRHGHNLGGEKSKMVGLSRLFSEIQVQLIEGTPSQKGVLVIGMAGIGKTTLAKSMFEDSSIVDHFECRMWVTVGPKYQQKEILRSILAQVNPDIGKIVDDELADYLSKSLKNKIWLIVLDDVWNSDILRDLLQLLPEKRNGNRVLVTSRIRELEKGGHGSWGYSCKMSLLNKEESWRLLRHRVFDEMPCPPELEKAGKKIAENCEGLPLTIVTVAHILSKADKTIEYWNDVADQKRHSVFLNAYEEMLEVLLPSYYYLPQYLKAFFLYMGILPQNYGIPLNKLINLWKAEGFLEPNSTDFEQFVKKCLDELISRSVVIFRRKMYFFGPFSTSVKFEKYHLHSAFLYMCVKEAGKIKFYRVLNSYTEDAEESMKSQRQLCIQNNVLFGIKDLYDSMASVSNARSLLCTGEYHQYPVPICLEYLMLLRVLDALTIRFYEFPFEVVKLIQLRYFAITYDGNLPTSLSKLLNLKFLIIHRNLSIVKYAGNSSYLPMEISDMKELEHLHVVGSDLPKPYEEESLLPNLLTLLDVSPKSCTKSVLERIPNLKKLGIRIELTSDDDDEPLISCFDHISQFSGLETLKCTIANPIFKSKVVVRARLPIFPECLKKICLSGTGYPWEEMSKIASLPNLQVLKLRCYAFRGPKWGTRGGEFPSLEYLLIEDSDLVEWIIGDNSFNMLGHLIIKHCYKLKYIRGNYLNCVRKTEVVDCDPLAAYYAKQISFYDNHVDSSWEDDGKKIKS